MSIKSRSLAKVSSCAETELHPREEAVLRGIANGMTYQQIADDLGLGYETVKTWAGRLRKKLGLHKAGLAAWAVRNREV